MSSRADVHHKPACPSVAAKGPRTSRPRVSWPDDIGSARTARAGIFGIAQVERLEPGKRRADLAAPAALFQVRADVTHIVLESLKVPGRVTPGRSLLDTGHPRSRLRWATSHRSDTPSDR